MPPKSNKKENQKCSWYACDKCGIKITQNQLNVDLENDCCPKFGISGENFIAKSINCALPQELELKDAPLLFLQRFLFVPETVCRFCNFPMDCNLLIEIDDGKKFVRKSWTISDKHLDMIYSSSSGN